MTNVADAQNRIQLEEEASNLRNLIHKHDQLYYEHGRPQIPDHEYDAIMRRLEDLEKRFPFLLDPDSPTQRVGGEPVLSLPQVRHAFPMLSIANVYKEDDLRAWIHSLGAIVPLDALRFAAEYKVDGVAVSLIYSDRLERAVSRGDGTVGDNITHNVHTAAGIPRRIPRDPQGEIEVRGELFIGNADFARVVADQRNAGEDPYVNSRAAVAGCTRLLDPKLAAKRRMRFMAYSGQRTQAQKTHSELMRYLQQLGFPRIPYYGENLTQHELLKHIDMMMDTLPSLDFPIDGIVVKVESFEHQALLGANSKAPRWAIAYKWERYSATTRVKAVTLQVGRTGAITPVAELEPVSVAATTVSRASLFNFKEIERLDVRVGDTVVVEKAGKIIPHILSVDVASSPPRDQAPPRIEAPVVCPVCGASTVIDSLITVRCSNADCPAVLQGRLEHFVSRGGMDIEGLGSHVIEQLLAAKLVTTIADLFELHRKKEQLLLLDGVGVKKMEKLLAGIEACKQKPLSKVLYALGIPHVGETIANQLAQYFETLEDVSRATEDDLRRIGSLGEKIATSVVTFFYDPAVQDLLELFDSLGMACMRKPAGVQQQLLRGLNIVVTGTLRDFDRNEIKNVIRANGGIVSDSVTRKTSYVVVGSNPGSKAAKAAALGVQTLTEDQFKQLLGDKHGEESQEEGSGR